MSRKEEDAIEFVRHLGAQYIYRSQTCNRSDASKAFYNMAIEVELVVALAEKQLESQGE